MLCYIEPSQGMLTSALSPALRVMRRYTGRIAPIFYFLVEHQWRQFRLSLLSSTLRRSRRFSSASSLTYPPSSLFRRHAWTPTPSERGDERLLPAITAAGGMILVSSLVNPLTGQETPL